MKRYTTTEHERGQRTAAGIVLAGDPATFGPGLVEWARRWTAGHPPKARRWQREAVASSSRTAQEPEQMRLFERTEAA